MKKDAIAKTNAARLLDKQKIAYELIPYRVDEHHLGAEEVAAQLGEQPEQVFKTIVLRGERCGIFVCVVPATAEVDLKKAAKVIGDKKCDTVAVKELLDLTGYIRGGCSPIGMKKAYPTLFHTTLFDHDHIFVSAGQRSLQLKLAPAVLLHATRGTVADIVKE